MSKKKFTIVILCLSMLLLAGCTLLKNPADKRMNFSTELSTMEAYVLEEDWDKAMKSLYRSMEKWKKIKPWMQLEIDHDLLNDIEVKLIELTAYMETKNQSLSLANVRVIINTWLDIGSK